ncbi:MAG: nucleotidyltransferase family protein [Bdellovibrionia bacterium]
MASSMRIAGLALAAGSSRRMGLNKLLLTLNGVSLLERSIQTLKKLEVEDILFVTGFEAAKIQPQISVSGYRYVQNENFESGMHSSIQAGVRALAPCDAILIFLCDQPLLEPNEINRMIRGYRKSGMSLAAPVFEGQRGHPVLLSAKYREKILSTDGGDRGCHYLFQENPDRVFSYETSNSGVLRDVDTPAGLKNLESEV